FTRYTIGQEETYMKVKILGIDEMPTRDNIATTRDGFMEEIGVDGGPRGETFLQQGDGIRVWLVISRDLEFAHDSLVKSSSLAIIIRRISILQRIQVFEQETWDLNVENKQKKDLKASYGVTTLQELRRNQIKEETSHHHSYGVTASSQPQERPHTSPTWSPSILNPINTPFGARELHINTHNFIGDFGEEEGVVRILGSYDPNTPLSRHATTTLHH
ncbi:hypothetical protein Tco_1145071, partial [Tanacetum coccineum]